MKASARSHNARHAREQLALLAALDAGYRVPDDELRAVAAHLGLSHALPDRQAELPLVAERSAAVGQRKVKG